VEDPAQRRKWLTFVIVGGGPTGVELAGSLGEIARHTLKHDFRSIRPQESQIFLLDGAPHILPSYPEDLASKAEKLLVSKGVQVRTGVRVTGVDPDGVVFHNSKGAEHRLEAKTVLWAGGVTVTQFGRVLASKTNAPTGRDGRIKLMPDLTVPGWPEIYVAGDLGTVNDEKGQPLPGVAQVAMQGGAYAAKAVEQRLNGPKDIPPFRYFNKGDLAVIGRGAAVANIFGLHLAGLPAWLVWLFVHLMYLVQFQSRVIVFVQWGFQYITFSRGARLITGVAACDPIATSKAMKDTVDD
jgi:NADH dehydrogenase